MTPAERYADRVARRLCVQCAAGLQDTDGVRCVECSAYQRTAPGKREREARHRSTDGYRAKHAADAAALYASAKAALVCADCGAPSIRFRRCQACRVRRAKYNASYRAKARAA